MYECNTDGAEQVSTGFVRSVVGWLGGEAPPKIKFYYIMMTVVLGVQEGCHLGLSEEIVGHSSVVPLPMWIILHTVVDLYCS